MPNMVKVDLTQNQINKQQRIILIKAHIILIYQYMSDGTNIYGTRGGEFDGAGSV